jgi:hypothetical protein
MTGVTIEQTGFETWATCLHLSNGIVELLATTDVGPRVLSCGFVDDKNLFYTDPEKKQMQGTDYTVHGGHRLWHAPEDKERTYVPDDDPVTWETIDRGVRLVGPTPAETGIGKTVSLRLAADEPVVEVTHELTNDGLWPVELAPWGVTVLGVDGTAVIPLSRDDEGLRTDRSLSLWPYTSLADDRLTLADEAVLIEGDPEADTECKIGASGADEYTGYVSDGIGFRKEFHYNEDATYPDQGSAVEVYTNGSLLELETLGPLQEVAPGESAVHTETWRLMADVAGRSTADLRAQLRP